MIKGFRCKQTAKIFERKFVKKIPKQLHQLAYRKLVMLNESIVLTDLSIPPANCLEKLKGDRKGQYSIRINKKWRICFRWKGNDAFDVEIVDYH